ncbi:unnamed protein product [Protopolystoma xenopodis]|uniref:Uncharacterized protein n=1 Tax=Protopolystoma xenopodis TaxID=117903 RepID=A0A448WJ24_9PLAT|nr:unnamed protein product [Protopolystoma xenopodis]
MQEGDGVQGCPLRCHRRLHSIRSHMTTILHQAVLPASLVSYFELLKLREIDSNNTTTLRENGPPIDSRDLILLDISPVSEMVNQVRGSK